LKYIARGITLFRCSASSVLFRQIWYFCVKWSTHIRELPKLGSAGVARPLWWGVADA